MPYLLMHVLEITFTLNINLYYRRKHIMTAKETNSLMNCKDYVIYRLDYTLGNFMQILSHMLPLIILENRTLKSSICIWPDYTSYHYPQNYTVV